MRYNNIKMRNVGNEEKMVWKRKGKFPRFHSYIVILHVYDMKIEVSSKRTC